MAKEEKGAVEKLKSRLYARGAKAAKPEERSPMSPNEVHAPTSWSEIHAPGEGSENSDFSAAGHNGDAAKSEFSEPPQPPKSAAAQAWEYTDPNAPVITPTPLTPVEPKKRMSLSTKFFFGSILFFIIAAGISALLFYGGVNTTSPQNIDVEVIAPSLIDGGKEADFEVIITNRNTTSLELADLVIDYPDGARSAADPTKSLTHDRISIGTITSGEQVKKTFSALLYGQEGAQEAIAARLEYSVSGSNAVFEKQGQALFTIGSAPVSVSIDAPSKVIAGDSFGIDITVRSNATTPVDNVTIEAQYPFGFSVSNTNPAAAAGGTLWRFGTLAPGTTKVIHITGSIDAADGDERVFRFLAGSNSDPTDTHVRVPFLTVPQTLSVEHPFITGSVSIEGKTGQNISVSAGGTLQGQVSWQNNLSDSISDLQLELSFSGPSVDKNSINSQSGFYQSSNNTIVWTKDRDASLGTVAPGATGTFQFSFATLPPAAQGTLITNPTITLNLTVRATRQNDNGVPDTIASAASAKLVLASALSLTAQSSRSGVFNNTGPVPPRVEQTTTYGITWTVKNSANTVANTSVQTVLPPYVTFVAAQSGSGVTYDPGSRTVTWNIGDIKAGVGYSTAARQASFQVAISPSSSQVGTIPALTGPTSASGQDRYAQVQVGANVDGPTTHTIDGSAGMDTVVAK
ncbi:MAG TPA: hypothetical protein VHD31_00145 [Candidatus Paceibacterota bacterium]|nr:hypothetical protein [Candidatus Paceibacterota bacterium]